MSGLRTLEMFALDGCQTTVYQKPSDKKEYCGFFLPRAMSWFEANRRCLRAGGRLPIIKSAEENTQIFIRQVGNGFFVGWAISRCRSTTPHPTVGSRGGGIYFLCFNLWSHLCQPFLKQWWLWGTITYRWEMFVYDLGELLYLEGGEESYWLLVKQIYQVVAFVVVCRINL